MNRRPTPPESVTGTGDLSVTGAPPEAGGAGLSVQDQRPVPIWAVITSHIEDNKYAFARVDEGDAPSFGELDGAPEVGDGIQLAAYELNERDDVPDGTKVQLWPSGTGDQAYYVFAAPGGSGGGGGGGGGSGTGCGWVASLTASDCLLVTVLGATGRCADDPPEG